MINELIKLATHLDKKGRIKEADYLDSIIRTAKDDDAAELSDGEKVVILIAGLYDLRDEVLSGSLEMSLIDEILGKIGEEPWSHKGNNND
jgi:hypothetical protein